MRAAQRAFFQAALNQTAASPAEAPSSKAAAPVVTSTPETPAERYLRPGSRIDIKV